MDAPHILWLIPAARGLRPAAGQYARRGAGARVGAKNRNAGTGADLIPFIDWAKQHFRELPLYMMGHSLGGTMH